MSKVTVAVQITVTDKQYDLICASVAGDALPAAKISQVANTLVGDLAEGGLMIPGETVDRIETAIKSIDPERIAETVEDSVNRKGSQVILKTIIDPGWEPSLREASESQGRPIEDLMQECLAHAFVQGWLYAIPAEPPPLLITRDDQTFLKEILGRETVFGADVMAWIRELSGPTEEAKEASAA